MEQTFIISVISDTKKQYYTFVIPFLDVCLKVYLCSMFHTEMQFNVICRDKNKGEMGNGK